MIKMKLPLIVLAYVTCSQSVSHTHDALVYCTNDDTNGTGDGVRCNGVCKHASTWCHDHIHDYCEESRVMTNDTDLCSNDDFWKPISCDLKVNGTTHFPGERCTGCTTGTSNYCFYPHGLPYLGFPGSKDYMKKIFPTTCDCISSQSINYDVLVKCSVGYGEGVMCDGRCLHASLWCYDHQDTSIHYCKDSGVMINDTDLCSNDDFWKKISCDLTIHGTNYPGRRCTGCKHAKTSNYCFYPHGLHDHPVEEFWWPTTCDCDSSQSINYDALVPCSNNQGVMCNGNCLPAALWCNDKFNERCDGLITNDPDLCADDQRWKNISCDLTQLDGTHILGERCTGCTTGTSNYCFYPEGSPWGEESLFPRTCECVSTTTSTIILVAIPVIVMIAAMAIGVYYYKKKQHLGPSHEAPGEATQESEMGEM